MPLALFLLLSFSGLFACTTAIPLEEFYPYGKDNGDRKLDPNSYFASVVFGDQELQVS